jgi:hypothetical protein
MFAQGFYHNNNVPDRSGTTVPAADTKDFQLSMFKPPLIMLRFRYKAVAAPGKTNDVRPSKNAYVVSRT